WARISGKSSVTIDLPMGRQDIADFLGLTIETVSRTLNRMARDKLIVIVPDGVRVMDAARLEAIASA
ncbi:MAG: winged helix-turn-helix domain-containing protein, partial [Hyphomicrobiales bacterium]|nr:winged helix-turn-helix domain-containing protein [Hyphomicrobiales bacterium]